MNIARIVINQIFNLIESEMKLKGIKRIDFRHISDTDYIVIKAGKKEIERKLDKLDSVQSSFIKSMFDRAKNLLIEVLKHENFTVEIYNAHILRGNDFDGIGVDIYFTNNETNKKQKYPVKIKF